MKELEKAIAGFLSRVIREGFELPIYIVSVGANGAIFGAQFDGPGKNTSLVSYIPPSNIFATPINIIFVDSAGRAARALIGNPEEKPAIQFLN